MIRLPFSGSDQFLFEAMEHINSDHFWADVPRNVSVALRPGAFSTAMTPVLNTNNVSPFVG